MNYILIFLWVSFFSMVFWDPRRFVLIFPCRGDFDLLVRFLLHRVRFVLRSLFILYKSLPPKDGAFSLHNVL